MKKQNKNQIVVTLTVAILLFSISCSVITMPSAIAHSPSLQIPTYAYINVAPNPVGVGQQVNIILWLGMPPPTANAQFGDRWENFTVKVTTPSGTTTTLGPFTSDATGGTSTTYTPTVTGNYTFVFNYGGQILAGHNLGPISYTDDIGDYFEPSTSNVATLTVQQEPVSSFRILRFQQAGGRLQQTQRMSTNGIVLLETGLVSVKNLVPTLECTIQQETIIHTLLRQPPLISYGQSQRLSEAYSEENSADQRNSNYYSTQAVRKYVRANNHERHTLLYYVSRKFN